MRLWTVQGSDAFFILNRDGVLHCSSPLSAINLDEGKNGALSRAYAWMAGQMEKRMTVPRPEKALYPLWAWAQVGSYKKEYHPGSGDYIHGRSVLLELDVPEEEMPQELRNYVVNSWERVFDLDRRDRFFSKMKRNRYIQATMWQIHSEWVKGYRML